MAEMCIRDRSWLAESEKAALQEQLDREQQGIKAVRNYGEAFRSRNVILQMCIRDSPGGQDDPQVGH